MVRTSLPIVIALSVCLASASAQGDTSNNEIAKKRFQTGSKFFVAGDYALAIEEFKAARLLVKRPSILFNIAQCYRNLIRPDKAIDYYLQYLKEWADENPGKPIPHRDEVDGFLKDNNALPGRKSKVPTTAPASDPVSTGEPAPKTEHDIKPKIAAPLAPAITEKTEPAKPIQPGATPIYKKWWLWTIVGAVVVGATTAAVVATQGGSPDYVTGTIPPGIVEIN